MSSLDLKTKFFYFPDITSENTKLWICILFFSQIESKHQEKETENVSLSWYLSLSLSLWEKERENIDYYYLYIWTL